MRFFVVAVLALATLVALPSRAHADGDLLNYSIGPVFGIKLTGPGDWPVIGLEAGVGYGPERINVGFEHRSDHDAGYIELDPWYIIGGSIGFAVDDENKAHGLAGLWEGVPVAGFDGGCNDWQNMTYIAGGYRYTGVHELFITIKAGRIDGSVCFD
ncbi:MAG TPA: hypothetical protein VL326_02940 [Kofleriaceae bacterium]|nr:hypothetical protein [Kofleriaceae bacterium]